MGTAQLELLALVIGLVVGAAATAAVVAALRARDRAAAAARTDVPEGLATILAAMDDAAAVVDPSGTVVASSSAAHPFGMREGTVLASEELRRLAAEARGADAAASATLRLHRDGSSSDPRVVMARASAAGPRLSLLVVRDVTERERVEEMRRDFVANTSHELKTPVGAVTLLSEAIEQAADDPDQVRDFARRLQAESSRLALLTSRIMNLSRLQASDELTDIRDVAVDEIVTSAIETHSLQAGSAGVQLVRGGQRGLVVQGDGQILVEALGNLIANAIVYSPSGSSVGIGARAVGDVAEIAVTDHGIGIAPDDQQRVFERFYRADQARSRRTGGTGLGLAIVKHAVQRHGGEVRLWSQPGRGSTFTIRLPRVAASDAVPAPRRSPVTAATATHSTATATAEEGSR